MKRATTILTKEPPATGAEAIDLFIEQKAAGRERLLAELVAECKSDPAFLDKALKELKPLRGRGASPRLGATRAPAVAGIMKALKEFKPGEIVEVLAVTLKVSIPQARRIYDQERKRAT